PLLAGATLAGHGVARDRSFLETAFQRARLPVPNLSDHMVDTASLAWPLYIAGETRDLEADSLAAYLGMCPDTARSALEGAKLAIASLRHLTERMQFGNRYRRLTGDEPQIMKELLDRMDAGRETYGPWRLNDGRNLRREALAEVLDALHYCAGE